MTTRILTLSSLALLSFALAGRADDAMTGFVDTPGGIQIIVDLRRGLDLLVARPEVDSSRLAYGGHSLGATRTTLLTRRRVKTAAWLSAVLGPAPVR
jgi:dienelactone hydrolase